VIPVPRTPKPSVLVRNAAKWLAKLEEVKSNPDPDPAAQKRKIKNAMNKYQHEEIKACLVAMFHGKCAYCESQITHVTYGDIEHFRAKSNPRYAHLIFEWENLLLSCPICNNPVHKGTQFPLDLNGNPLLIDPTDGVTDPTTHLEFSWDAVAGLATVYGRDARGQEVERIFDFNGVRGRKELIKDRSNYVKTLMALLPYAKQGNLEAVDILKQACQPDAKYSAFARVLILPHLP
jgi:5-methylcytosine-specific restriction endonuclease McrA